MLEYSDKVRKRVIQVHLLALVIFLPLSLVGGFAAMDASFSYVNIARMLIPLIITYFFVGALVPFLMKVKEHLGFIIIFNLVIDLIVIVTVVKDLIWYLSVPSAEFMHPLMNFLPRSILLLVVIAAFSMVHVYLLKHTIRMMKPEKPSQTPS